MNKHYYIIKKNINNSTHVSYIDCSIKYVLAFKQLKYQLYIKIVLYCLTIGLIHILFVNYPNMYINLLLSEADNVFESTVLIVIDSTDKKHFVYPRTENFYQTNYLLTQIINNKNNNYKPIMSKEKLSRSNYKGEDIYNLRQYSITFYFLGNKYVYKEDTEEFVSNYFDICKYTNNEIYCNFEKGIPSIFEYNYLLNKFGLNTIDSYSSNLNLMFKNINIIENPSSGTSFLSVFSTVISSKSEFSKFKKQYDYSIINKNCCNKFFSFLFCNLFYKNNFENVLYCFSYINKKTLIYQLLGMVYLLLNGFTYIYIVNISVFTLIIIYELISLYFINHYHISFIKYKLIVFYFFCMYNINICYEAVIRKCKKFKRKFKKRKVHTNERYSLLNKSNTNQNNQSSNDYKTSNYNDYLYLGDSDNINYDYCKIIRNFKISNKGLGKYAKSNNNQESKRL